MVEKNGEDNQKSKSWVKEIAISAILIVIALALLTPCQFKAIERAAMAEAISNARQVKLALDAFAMDFDGQFPSESLHQKLGTRGSSSNALFRQLFVAESTEAEVIFWVKNSSVANEDAPDDQKPILRNGEVHWAYLHGLKNDGPEEAPIIVDPWKPQTHHFDPKLWENKAIVVRVDGSAKPIRLQPSSSLLLDQENKNLLSAESSVWNDAAPDLRQPEL